MLRHLEENPLPSAKRVKELLTVRLELVLVVHVHGKLLAIQHVRGIVCLAVVCNKPVNEPQAHFTGSLEQFYDFVDILALTVKALEACNDQFLLAVNLLLTGLRVGCDFGDGGGGGRDGRLLDDRVFHDYRWNPGILRPLL